MARQIRNAALVWCGVVAVLMVAGAALTVRDRGRVAPNVEVAGQAIGGYSAEDAKVVIEALAADFASLGLVLETPDGPIDTSMGALGIRLDVDATHDLVLEAGRDAPWPLRPIEAVGVRFLRREVALQFADTPVETQRRLGSVEGAVVEPPGVPGFRVSADGDTLVADAGAPGRGVVADDVLALVRRGYRPGLEGLRVDVAFGSIPPLVSLDQAEALLPAARAATDQPLVVQVHDMVDEVEPATQRSWITTFDVDGDLTLGLDDGLVVADLARQFRAAGTGPGGTRFEIVDAPGRTTAGQIELGGTVRPLPGKDGAICCAPGSAFAIFDAMVERPADDDGAPVPARPPLRPATEAEMNADVESLGIIQFVGGFTTTHACCASRVTNIHRIADLVDGHVIRPGDTFSLNGFVGRRTRAKGFVSAGVISNGRFVESIGGGISQFATTLFNAAFFSGLDFGEYQSHSIYISRYPRGREATVSFPHPDLQIVNATPYGVLIDTAYTGTSISVSMYSTRHVEVEARGPFASPVNRCTRWTTERIRTYPGGERVEDSVFAVYRPAEGRDCNGNPT